MQLLPHQIEDAQFLSERRFAGCFSGMGSGKTLTALEAVRLAVGTGKDAPLRGRGVLIVAPPIALRMWQREFESHLQWGQPQILKTGKTKVDPHATAWICSYEIATKRQQELGELVRGGVLICDESHALKNVKAKRTKAILGKGGIAAYPEHVWMLTGTPVTRWNDDLYPFLCRADMAGLKQRAGGVSMDKFRLRYCVTQKRWFPGARYPTRMTVGNMNTDELRDWLYEGGLAVRRELKDVWDAMPAITVNRYDIRLQMSDELREALKALKGKSIAQIQHDLTSGDESMSTTRRLLGLGKARDAAEVIAERIESGLGPVLVGVWHTDVIDALEKELSSKGLNVAVIDGRCSQKQKHAAEDAFNAGRVGVLLGQIASMGVSLNLQAGGNRIIVVEEDWSPSIMDQFYARLYRMGQERPVHIDILQNDNTLEDALQRIAGKKRSEHARLNRQEETTA